MLLRETFPGRLVTNSELFSDLVGIGAIRHIDAAHIEVKSMHTLAEMRGQGVGHAILNDLMARARAKGYTRMSLETGSTPEFAPARALYAAHGVRDYWVIDLNGAVDLDADGDGDGPGDSGRSLNGSFIDLNAASRDFTSTLAAENIAAGVRALAGA